MNAIATSAEPLEARIAPAFAASLNLSGLDGSSGFKISGEGAAEYSGISVSDAGDVNGDGFGDVIVGAHGLGANGNLAGSGYVVFGKAGGFGANIDLSSLDGTNGFKMTGEATQDFAGRSVSAAGDMNGDGFDDVIIGAYHTNPFAGTCYVIFGKASFAATPNIALSTLNGTAGFKLSAENFGDALGFCVANAGDVNHDGFDDIIVGARMASPHGPGPTTGGAGASYVIFGHTGAFANLSAGALTGSNGFRISGDFAFDASGFSVAGAGDVNGDGFDDVIVGAPDADPHGDESGAAYVILGKSSFAGVANIDVASLTGANGFKLSGAAAGDYAGRDVSGAGDINGDGFDDILVGANEAGSNTGAAYVIFGKAAATPFAANLDLSTLSGSVGFKIAGESSGDRFGVSPSGLGDVNGDGLDDFVVGAYKADPHGSQSGAAYVIFGRSSGFASGVNLATLDGKNGFQLNGVAAGDGAGFAVSGAGDVNHDGIGDLIVGASNAAAHGTASGASYVVFGQAAAGPLVISADGKTATILDADGDVITVKTSRGKFTADNFTRTDTPVTHLGQLQLIDVSNAKTGQAFKGATISVAVTGTNGDGIVNVGYVNATDVDLASVTIAGDLGRIDAGDATAKTPGLGKLTVGTLGALGTTTQAAGGSLVSHITGARSSLRVNGAMHNAFLDVTSGAIGTDAVFGKIGKVALGSLVADNSAGDHAGSIRTSGAIGRVVITGAVQGADGNFSGGISSGTKFGKTTIGGGVTGGAGERSGALISGAGFGSISIGGDLIGGTGSRSGSIVALGGNAPKIAVTGAISSGTQATNDAVGIFIDGTLGTLTAGSLVSPGGVFGVIAALGRMNALGAGIGGNAIGKIVVAGSVSHFDIAAGFDDTLDLAGTDNLARHNRNASIGTVRAGGTWSNSFISAGTIWGADHALGSGGDDAHMPGDTLPKAVAKIAKIILTGPVTGVSVFEAERVDSLTIAGAKAPLTRGLDDIAFSGATVKEIA